MQILKTLNKKEFESILNTDSKEIIEEIKNSGLSGRGGAGFPTGKKWEITRNAKGKSILICNADESEPGTFKDRFILENNLITLLQGIKIGEKVLDADCYIYVREEYSYLKEKIKNKSKEINLDLNIVTGAGAYICGEETALINSIEGKRGQPRTKPPYPTNKGLSKRPTCVNNVETLTNVALLLGKNNWEKNLRLFSISGDVKKPGVYEISLNTKLKKIINNCEKEKPKAILLGYSGGIIPFKELKNLKVNEKNFKKNSLMLGTCSFIVLNKKRSIPKTTENICNFFVHESCGKCIPCREGGYKILRLIKKINKGEGNKKDFKKIKVLSDYMKISFCPLGKGYGFTVSSAIKNFKKEFEEKCK